MIDHLRDLVDTAAAVVLALVDDVVAAAELVVRHLEQWQPRLRVAGGDR